LFLISSTDYDSMAVKSPSALLDSYLGSRYDLMSQFEADIHLELGQVRPVYILCILVRCSAMNVEIT